MYVRTREELQLEFIHKKLGIQSFSFCLSCKNSRIISVIKNLISVLTHFYIYNFLSHLSNFYFVLISIFCIFICLLLKSLESLFERQWEQIYKILNTLGANSYEFVTPQKRDSFYLGVYIDLTHSLKCVYSLKGFN